VEGIGEDFFPSTFDAALLDDIVRVDDRECFMTTRALVRLEGLYCGGSGGAAVAGAIKYAGTQPRSGEGLNIVVLLPDGSAKYLSKIFNDEWMREHGFLDDEGLGSVADLMRFRPTQEIIRARDQDSVRDVIATLKKHGISQIPVLKDGALIGVVTELSLLRYLATGEQSLKSTVEDLVESDYATVSRNTSIESVHGLLNDARMAIVLDGEEIVGVITKIDIIEYLARGRGSASWAPPK